MSRKITVQCEIRNMLIMKDTLHDMGFDFNENGNILEIGNSTYDRITINGDTQSINFDDAKTDVVNKIKQQYTVNFYREKAIKEGMQLHQEVSDNGEIVLYLKNN